MSTRRSTAITGTLDGDALYKRVSLPFVGKPKSKVEIASFPSVFYIAKEMEQALQDLR